MITANDAPLVSIIVPCYKQAEFLSEALESVLSQTMSNWECIVIDDGSPDNTEAVVMEWVKKDSRFKYVKKENSGVSSARNTGIRNGKGKYILPLDADDKISKNYLKETTTIMESDASLKLVYTDAEKFGIETGFWQLYDYAYETLLVANTIHCTALFKRADFLKTEGYSEEMKEGLEDWEFWISFLKDGGKVHKIPVVHFYYRIKEISRNQSVSEKIMSDLKTKIFLKHIDSYIKCIGNPIDIYEDRINFKEEIFHLKHRLRNAQKNTLLNHFKHEIKMLFKKVLR